MVQPCDMTPDLRTDAAYTRTLNSPTRVQVYVEQVLALSK